MEHPSREHLGNRLPRPTQLLETKLPGSLPTPFPALTQRHSADGQGWFGQVARGLVQGDQGQLTPQKNQTQNETDL